MTTPPPSALSLPPFITQAQRDVATWASCFDAAALPVLRSTAAALEELRWNEDAVDAHMLADALAPDPLMTLKVLAHVAHVRRGREGGEPETLTAALVMLGITPFFRHFGPQAAAEEVLGMHPGAMEGFTAVLARSRRAARFALGFAVHRMDHDARVIHEAALLHDFAELLMWLRAPGLAQQVRLRQLQEPGLRSASIQKEVFKVMLSDVQHALMLRWRLPRLLVDLADDQRECVSAQARNVALAIRLARHTAVDWNNPAIADDVRDIAALLQMSPEHTLLLLKDLDED